MTELQLLVKIACGCGRAVHCNGAVLVVESAIDPDGGSPVDEGLNELRYSKNKAKRRRYNDLKIRFEQIAAYGSLEVPREMNELSGELMEIKTAQDRVPFYFRAAAIGHKRAARLTHVFAKSTGKTADGRTPRKHIDKGVWVIKGDSLK